MTVKLKVTDEFKKFTIKLAADETYDSTITYDPVREVLSLDRSRSGYMYDILHKRDIQVKPAGGEVTLRILMDRFSVEILSMTEARLQRWYCLLLRKQIISALQQMEKLR